MGYYANLHNDTNIEIEVTEEDFQNARQACMDLDPDGHWGFKDATDFVQLLECLGFESFGEIGTEHFGLGFYNKWSSQEAFLDRLAPWMGDSFIGFVGEDNEMWGYQYGDGEMKNMNAQTVWV